MAGEAAAQFHLLDLAVGREGARLTQTPQYLVIVLSDGWSLVDAILNLTPVAISSGW